MELKGFTKLNEATAPELLKDEELAKLEDCVLDEELGRPLKRGGWERHNSNAVASTILSLHEAVTPTKNYLLAGANGALYKSEDGTGVWSSVTTKGTPPYRMQAYADEFIFTDGLVAPFVVSGNTLGTVTDLEIEKPSSAEIALIETAHAVGGNLTSYSMYKWVFVYVTDTGAVSPPSDPFTAHYDAAISGVIEHNTTGNTIKMVGFKNLPVSADPRVTARYVYRTMANGEVYYFHSQINNTITTWYDQLADSDLGSESPDFVNIPNTAKYITLHKERILLGNITRVVKNWIMPAYSHRSTTQFDVTYNGDTVTFDQLNSVDIKTLSVINSGDYGYTGTLGAGDYVYKFAFYDNSGLISDTIQSDSITITANQIVIIYPPPSVADGYDAITRAEVYRQKDGGTFYLVKEYDPQNPDTEVVNSTSAWLDVGWTNGAEFVSNQTVDTEKCGVAFSEIGQPATFVLEDIRNIFPDDGDEITGIYDDQDGILVFKTRSICKIYTNGSPDNWRLVKVVTNIGCSEPNALIKYGNTYVFVSNGEIYKFTSGQGYENIGVEIWNSLDGVTTWHSSMADDGWYVFGVTGSMTKGYGFLVYDYIVGSWYIFNINGIPYASLKDNDGNLLTSQGTYVCKYGEGTVDAETGSNVDITPILRTKTFGEAIALVRLRRLKFNYKKLDGKTLTITIVNPDTAVTNTYSDTTNSTNASDFKLYETPVRDVDSLKETSKFYVNLSGAGFSEFGSLRVEAKPILKGKRNV